jgi:uncharacterized membrane protein
MKMHKIKNFGQPIRRTVSKSGISSCMILLSDNTILQMINETTIQIVAGIILLIALIGVIRDHLKNNKETDAEDAQ